jgi:hypothetical protein
VQEGIRRREIRRSVEPCRIATTIIATLEGALMISRLEGSKAALRDAEKSLGHMLEEIACPARKDKADRNPRKRAVPASIAGRSAGPVQ